MEPLPHIPTPPALLWREFRLQVVPVITFVAVVAAVVLLWTQVNVPQTMSGLGEGARSLVASPEPGLLQEVLVRPYQLVNQGDPLAIIRPLDPGMPLDFLQAELALARLRFEPSLAEQNAMNYERVRSDMLQMQSELAVARVNLERAENEVRRSTPLYQEQLVSEDLWDLAVKTRDAFKAEVKEKSAAVAQLQDRMEQLRTLGEPGLAATDKRPAALLARLEQSMSAAVSNWGPITLTAPISGMVGPVNRQPGEFIIDGEPLVSVQALWSERVVGYLRQPYPTDPEVGQPVQITTRNRKRQIFWGEISQVGAQVEIITNALAFIKQGALVDVGLPIVVSVPDQLRLRPGEMVDLRVMPARTRPEAGPPKQPDNTKQPASP